MFNRFFQICPSPFATLLLSSLIATGCGQSSSNLTHGRKVKQIDAESSTTLDTNFDIGSERRAASEVTNRLLASRVAAKWNSSAPRLALGQWRNLTSDERIEIGGIKDRIKEVLVNSGAVRVVNPDFKNFDYIIKGKLRSSTQYDDSGDSLVRYVMTIELYDKLGEFLGSWSEDFAYLKS